MDDAFEPSLVSGALAVAPMLGRTGRNATSFPPTPRRLDMAQATRAIQGKIIKNQGTIMKNQQKIMAK